MATLRRHQEQVKAYADAVDAIYTLVPALDEHLQQIKRGYPKRGRPPHYNYPDVYHRRVKRKRDQIHQQLRSVDAKVKLFDTQAEYFNEEEHPFLVDAQLRLCNDSQLRAEGIPLTVLSYAVVIMQGQSGGRNDPHNRYFGFDARCYVAQGLPAIEVQPQGTVDSVLQWVGLQKDVKTNDKLFDEAFRVLRPNDPTVPYLLTSEVRGALRTLGETTEVYQPFAIPRLVIHNGEAQVTWLEKATAQAGLTAALRLLQQLRETSPPMLLTTAAPLETSVMIGRSTIAPLCFRIMHLVSCPDCARHFRAEETACPFCQHTAMRVGPRGLAAVALLSAGLTMGGCSSRGQTIYGGPPTPEPIETSLPAPEPTSSSDADAKQDAPPAPEASADPSKVPQNRPDAPIYGAPSAPPDQSSD